MVDALAKARANLLLPPESTCTQLERCYEARVAFYRGAALVLALCPRPADAVEASLSRAAELAFPTLVVCQEHVLAFSKHRARWSCLRCARSRTPGRMAHFRGTPCGEDTASSVRRRLAAQ